MLERIQKETLRRQNELMREKEDDEREEPFTFSTKDERQHQAHMHDDYKDEDSPVRFVTEEEY